MRTPDSSFTPRALRARALALLLWIALAFGSLPVVGAPLAATDPLPSWNNGPVKQAIVAFVQRVTTEGGAEFVPVADRIATFDNDGTLWPEIPLPPELYFIMARVRQIAEQDPSLKQQQPFKAAQEGDTDYLLQASGEALIQLVEKAYGNVTQEEFMAEASAFLATARHPVLNRPFAETGYRPMLELLAYLRENGFQTWLCSGGSTDFMRAFAPWSYGIPSQQIIGTTMRRESRIQDGRRIIWRLPEVDSYNDEAAKPVNIDRQIGKRPVFVGGNVLSGGDIAMMEYSIGRRGPSFQLLIHHDDSAREFAYDERDNTSLNAARQYGFTVVSVRNDWKELFRTTAPEE